MSGDTPYDPGAGKPFSSAVPPPLYAFEKARLESLQTLEPYAPNDDPTMLSIASHAAEVFEAKVGMVSVLGERKERVLACVGYETVHPDRTVSFCAYTILEPDALAVEDTTADPRFRDNPFVVGEPYVRFYAGAPIFDASGLPLGAVCVIDLHPREASLKCLLILQRLSEIAATVLQTRRLFAQTHPHGATEGETQTHHDSIDALLNSLNGLRAPRD